MRKLLLPLFITVALAPCALASWGSSLPGVCDQGDFFIRTDNTIWWCDSPNHWTVLPSSVAVASASDHSITPCGANTFVTGLSTTWALTCNQPSASNLTDGTTGTGSVVRSTSPSVTTPTVSGNLAVSGGNIVQTVSSGNIANTFTNTTASGNASTMQLTGNNTAGVTSNYWGVSHADSSQTTRWSWGFNASLALSWWSRQTSYPAGFTAGDVTQMTLDTSGNLTATGKLLGTGVDAINSGYQVELANDTTTGTAQRLLVKLTGAPSKVRTTATTDTAGALGICALGCSTSGAAVITLRGFETCTFDGATTAGDFVSISSSTAGNCHDSGSSRPTNAAQIVGRVLSTNPSGGTYTVWLTPDDTGTVGGTCTNQAVTGVTLGTGIGCSTITSAFVNNTIAITGSDINTSSQVTATHLASALPIAQGGTGQTSLAFTYPTYSAGNFTGNGSMTWTVDSGDVATWSVHQVAKRVHIEWYLNTTSVGGTPNIILQIALPAGTTIKKSVAGTNCFYTEDNGSTFGQCRYNLAAGGTSLQIIKLPIANWTATTNLTGIYGEADFEAQ